MKKVLIISYFFPPSANTGGRRWAKFAKFLNRRGYDVYVLRADIRDAVQSPWADDVGAIASRVYSFRVPDQKVPFHRMNMTPDTVAGKIRYHYSFWKEKRMINSLSGDYNDLAASIEGEVKLRAEELIVNKIITNVIVTGGPFRLCYYVAKLKREKFPDMNLIVDYRDFWINGSNYLSLDEKRRSVERGYEEYTVRNADHIIAVNDMIIENVKEHFGDCAPAVQLIPHGFDPDDFEHMETEKEDDNAGNEIKIVYAGTLYPKMEKAIFLLIDLLKMAESLQVHMRVEFFSRDRRYEKYFQQNGIKSVRYNSIIPAREMVSLIRRCDAALTLRGDVAKEEHFRSSKFYELIMTRKPILYIGPRSSTSEYIVNNKLGFSICEKSDITPDLLETISTNIQTQEVPDESFDISEHSFEHLTDKLENLLV